MEVDVGSQWISEDDWYLMEAINQAGLHHSPGRERDYFITRTEYGTGIIS